MPYTGRVAQAPHSPPENWITQVRKGVLELCVLNALRDRSRYGYDIVRSLAPVAGLVVSEGTVYPILTRLRREGMLRSSIEPSSEGPPRKYYALTPAGRTRMKAMNRYWQGLIEGIDRLIAGAN